MMANMRFKGQEGSAANAPTFTHIGVPGVTALLMRDLNANPLDYADNAASIARRQEVVVIERLGVGRGEEQPQAVRRQRGTEQEVRLVVGRDRRQHHDVGGVERIAGLHRRVSPGKWADAAALAVPAGTLLVLAGYFTGEFVELAGAVVLTAGMWIVGWLTWRQARGGGYDRLTRVLLGTSGVVLAASMVLAVSWALGEATGIPHPSLGWMAATHGVANALGFAVCGVVGWLRVGVRTR